MKFAVSPGWFTGSYEDRVKATRAYGFSAIEHLGWVGVDLDSASAVLREYDVVNTALFLKSEDTNVSEIVGWHHGMVYEDSIPYVMKAFAETAAAAKKLVTPNIVMISGDERFDVSREKQLENCVKALRAVAPMAEDAGLTVCVEPLNRIVDHKGYFLNTSADAFDIIKQVDSPAVRVLFDVYHQQVTEGNVIRNLTENLPLIGHVHVADNPGRNQPATGELNYPVIFDKLATAGYDKYLAFECGTTLPTEELVCEMKMLISPFEK